MNRKGLMQRSPPAGRKELQFYEELGSGSFGKVYRVYDPNLGKVVAVKMIEMDTSSDVDEALKELAILSELRCDQITRYFSAALYDSILCVSMEYCAVGSCCAILRQYTVFQEDSAAYVLNGVFKGLEYVHSQKKIHRDLKSANILVTHDCVIKLADFGVSAQLSRTTPERNSFMGTPYWMAPEVIQSSNYNTSVDIWSAAIVGYELVTGMPPYRKLQPTEAMMRIVDQPPPQVPSRAYKYRISQDFIQLMRRCLVKDPAKRITASELLQTKYMRNHSTVPDSFRQMVEHMLYIARERNRDVPARTLENLADLAPPKTKHSMPLPREEGSNSDVCMSSDEFDLSFEMPSPSAQSPAGPVKESRPSRPLKSPSRSPRARAGHAAKAGSQAESANRLNIPRMSSKRHRGGRSDQKSPQIRHDTSEEKSAQMLINRAFTAVKMRAREPAVIIRINSLAEEINEINADFPGFTPAFLQEIWRAIVAIKTSPT